MVRVYPCRTLGSTTPGPGGGIPSSTGFVPAAPCSRATPPTSPAISPSFSAMDAFSIFDDKPPGSLSFSRWNLLFFFPPAPSSSPLLLLASESSPSESSPSHTSTSMHRHPLNSTFLYASVLESLYSWFPVRYVLWLELT